jgi:hypothetical protein
MTGDDSAKLLAADVEKYTGLLEELHDELDEAIGHDVEILGKTRRTAAMAAAIIESYYTCCETIFFRISQFFENSLSDNRWHKDLLEKMTLEITDLRPNVIDDGIYNDLHELLRFRHFKRYYFSLAFDWERLDEIIKRTRRVHPKLLKNLRVFKSYIEELI